MRRSKLSLAFVKVHEGLAAILTNSFFSRMLQAFETFVECDAYPILSELLQKKKAQMSHSDKAVNKINVIYNLLDAHVFTKVGETEQECKSLLAFLRAAYTELTTYQVAKIALSVLYRSLFSFMIY